MLNFALASCCSSDRFFLLSCFLPLKLRKAQLPWNPLSLSPARPPLQPAEVRLPAPQPGRNLWGDSWDGCRGCLSVPLLSDAVLRAPCPMSGNRCFPSSPSFLAMDSGRAVPVTPWWLQAEMSSSVWKIQSLWGDPQTAVVNLHVYKAFLVSKLFSLSCSFPYSLTSHFPSAFGITCSFQFLIFHPFPY